MKFLIITNHSYMLWQFRRELIAELLKHGEVVISTPFVGHEDDFAAMGCSMVETKLDRRGMNPMKDLTLYRFYSRLIRSEKPDKVITYSIKPNVYAGFACRLQKVPYYVNVQGLGTAFQSAITAAVATILYKTALKKASCVFFENFGNAEEFVKRKIVPPLTKKTNQTEAASSRRPDQPRVVVLSGAGVNLDYFPYEPYPDEKDGIHFLYLGRIMREKGMDEFFSAAERLKKEYQDRVHSDLVGFFEEEYKTIVERLSDEGVIRFHGFQQDPRPWYKAAHCIVLPSYHEGMSNVLLEGAATGRPLITTDIPGCREAVDDRKTGLLIKVKNSEALYNAMKTLLSLSTQDRCEMGRQGRLMMKREFDRERVVDTIISTLGNME